VSVSHDGGASFGPAISTNGRFVAFQSEANDLVPGRTNIIDDIFVHDRQTHTTRRVSISSTGVLANDGSFNAAISGDGRFVAFNSSATNLVADDTNGAPDSFVRDRLNGTTERVSVNSAEQQANGSIGFGLAISADGRYVAFSSSATNLVVNDTNNCEDVFVRDRTLGTTIRVSVASNGTQANGCSFNPAISADGQHVAFESLASNLVTGDSNNRKDVFVRHLANER
jgi:Tol biopolymer transport system component